MDNRKIDVVSEGDQALELALRLIWPNAAGGKATHYRVVKLKEEVTYFSRQQNAKDEDTPTSHYSQIVEHPNGTPTLILLWHEEGDCQALPFPLKVEDALAFVRGWLQNAADYGRQPDHDGDNGKGWRLFTDFWGHVAGHHYAIVGVQPQWAMYGK